MYVHTHVHIRTHIRTHTCAYIHTYTYAYIYTHMYVHTHIHIRTHAHTHVRTYTYAHIYTHTHARTHICTYTHTHVQSCERHIHVFISTTVLTPMFCSAFSRHRPKRTGHRRRRMTWCRVLETRVSSEPTAHNLLLGPAVTTDCEIPRVQSWRLLTQSDCGSDRW